MFNIHETNILSVSQVNQYIKSTLDNDALLGSIAIRGEISNYKRYSSGHHYFSLKDANGVLSCVMFRGDAEHLKFQAENGVQVVAFGRISVFPRDGRYQLYVNLMVPDGVGDLNQRFEQLKRQLEQEGLFDASKKKRIPQLPKVIALITSPTGAAVRDMIRVLGARWPMTKVVVMGVRVQGAEAPPELVGALRYANRYQVADLIIMGRGGGSIEELWAFNDERVARAIYESEIPVISAVGHEPDVTIADYVADLRAATPSNGAELAVPNQLDVSTYLNQIEIRIAKAMATRISHSRNELERLATSRVLQNPRVMIDDKKMHLDIQQERLMTSLEHLVLKLRERYSTNCGKLDSLSPLKVLSRGYGLVQTADGGVITAVRQIDVGDNLTVSFGDGRVECTVFGKEINDA